MTLIRFLILIVGVTSLSAQEPRPLHIVLPDLSYFDPETESHSFFLVSWSDAAGAAYVSRTHSVDKVPNASDVELNGDRRRVIQQWQDTLVKERGRTMNDFQTEFVGWFADRDEAGAKREARLEFLKERLRYQVEEHSDWSPWVTMSTKPLPEATGVHSYTHHFVLEQDGLELSGRVTFNVQFLFFGYPYLKANYRPLVIDAVTYDSGDSMMASYFDEQTNQETRRFITFPYTVSSGGYHLAATFMVRLPWVSDDGETLINNGVGGRYFAIETDQLTPLADTYDDEAIDTYFRNYEHPVLHDSVIWEAAILQARSSVKPVYLKKISESITRDIRMKLDAYRKEQALRP